MLDVRTLPQRPLPREAFVSEAQLALEHERIFRAEWRYVGHVSQLRAPGSFLRYELGDDSVLVVRGRDGALRAMHNVCRHRGARLVTERRGTCAGSIVCPYHGWAYRLDGGLRGAPRMQPSFRPEGLDLKPVWLEEWNGLVFVSLAADRPAPIADRLADVPLAPYRLAEAKVAFEQQEEVAANWKVLWENGLECYHCAVNHPELRVVVDTTADGNAAETFEPRDYEYTDDFPLLGAATSVTVDGAPRSRRLLADGAAPSRVLFLQWHLSAFELIAAPDHAHLMLYEPLSPGRSRIHTVGLVHADAQEGVDFDVEQLFELHRVTRGQDNPLCERVQLGISSPAYEPGPYNDFFEFPNRNFVRVYQAALAR